MFSLIRKRFTYANVAVTLALVFAMSGGAYAASRYVITSTKQISPKVLKSLQGKAGANGAQGPAGPTGPAGAQGPAGPVGGVGTKGDTGATGVQGPAGPAGPQGPAGTTGFTKTLPAGETLKGEWSVSGYASAELKVLRTAVSYAFPLAKAPTTHYIRPGAALPAGCTGSVEDPGAEKGNLCVFAEEEENTLQEFGGEHFPAICDWGNGECSVLSATSEGEGSLRGFGIDAGSAAAGAVNIVGTWAVTAE
jgi:hypothetical protein